MNRRHFLKMSTATAVAMAASTAGLPGGKGLFRTARAGTLPVAPQGSMGARETTSVCEMCFWRCPIVGKVREGKLIKIEGNSRSPVNGRRVCARGNSGVQLLYDPDRIKYPMKRVGARGKGKWARISWDEALDEIAHNMDKVRKKYGPHALAFFDHGASAEHLRKIFINLGTENYTSEPAFFQCVGPAALAYLETVGYTSQPAPASTTTWPMPGPCCWSARTSAKTSMSPMSANSSPACRTAPNWWWSTRAFPRPPARPTSTSPSGPARTRP